VVKMPTSLLPNNPKVHDEEDMLSCLLDEARINGYIQGMTDTTEQHKQTISNVLHSCIPPFMKAYQIVLEKKLNIRANIRAQFNINAHIISIVAIMSEDDYLKYYDNIYLWERAFEDILLKQYPNMYGFCIDISTIPFSDKSPLDQSLITNDFPYVIS
jgi:hypothetical protein